MSNDFFQPGPERAARVHSLFGQIARRYDLINDLQSFGLHRFWKRKVLRLASVRPGDRALDLCCGTGDIALGLAWTGAAVAGLDFSAEMLEIAGRKKSQMSQPDYLRADAELLPFQANSFEIVTMGYGLRNLTDWKLGIREMIRVAKPGGKVIVLEFGRPDNSVWRATYFGYLKLFVPLLGLIFCGSASAYAYILESLKHYPAQRIVGNGMSDLGLLDVRVMNLLGGAMSINYGRKPALAQIE